MLDGPLYSGPFVSYFVFEGRGLNSCLGIIVYLLDVENVVGNVGIYLVSNTIHMQFTLSLCHVSDRKIFVTVLEFQM